MTLRKHLFRLVRDNGGAALVEFALVAPIMLMALLGLFDLSYNIYAASMLEGAIQKAARDSTIEGADTSGTGVDARVTQAVHRIVPNATITFERASYASFADISRPEDFTDLNNDGICNNDEPFEDVNSNAAWDSDRGQTGNGGARDAVLYTVWVRYDRKLPMPSSLGLPSTVTTMARTVLRNQPFSSQDNEVTVGSCA